MRRKAQRTCIGCRTVSDQGDLVRFIALAEGESGGPGLRLDPKQSLPGRGAYLCRNLDCWREAMRRRAVQRALRAAPSPDDLNLLQADLEAHIAGAAPHGGGSGHAASRRPFPG